MVSESIWINGPTRSGKTSRLIEQFCYWLPKESTKKQPGGGFNPGLKILVLAANDDNRRELADKLAAAIKGRSPLMCKTPLGFFQDEVILFWPLLIQQLNIKAQFPLRLRPETEQELANKLWQPQLESGKLAAKFGASENRVVRRILDLLQLAAVSGTLVEDIPQMLEAGLTEITTEESADLTNNWLVVGQMLLDWRQWCLERGLLSYGIISELYWRYLLPEPTYQQHLKNRYQAVLADDVDDYPAIARYLFDFLLDAGAVGAFTYNTDGSIRLGLNADPYYLSGMAARCRVETLAPLQSNNELQTSIADFADSLSASADGWIDESMFVLTLPSSVQSIQTISRAQLLRQTGEVIIDAIESSVVEPQEIAVIAPGLDAIARYTIVEILTSKGIPVESLNDQRPLISSPMIRALLTLLALVYRDLGRLVDRDAVAEMLVVLSTKLPDLEKDKEGVVSFNSDIDPVRAGLLADYCYSPDPEQPKLLPVTAFPRWDRLGYRATAAYEGIVQWLEDVRSQQQQNLIPSALIVLDRAIQQFLWNGSNIPYDQLAALRELMETAQHYWEVDGRLRKSHHTNTELPAHTTIGRFIQLLRRGTITANPYPVKTIGPASRAVTISNIFQYRASRRSHRWHFWLDAGSPLWLSGGVATLFGYSVFLKDWSGEPWTEEDTLNSDRQRLQRILRDLLRRVGEKVYLCHSDLATNGQDQDGPLLPLVNAAMPINFNLKGNRERETGNREISII